jgi:hypothetical protein
MAACQWAWVTGSMEAVKVPFLYHKAATYHFAKECLSDPQTAGDDNTLFLIASLAMVEVRRVSS